MSRTIAVLFVPLLLAFLILPVHGATKLNEANALFSSGRFAEAEQAYRAILGQSPDAAAETKALFNLGLTVKKQARYDEAISIFNRLINSKTADDLEAGGHLMEPYRNYRPRASWEKALCLLEKRDYAQSRAVFKETKDKHPFRSWCGNEAAAYDYKYRFYDGLCQDHLGNSREALKSYFSAAFESKMMYSEPAVHFRILGMYESAGELPKLTAILNEIDESQWRVLNRSAIQAGRRINDEEFREHRATGMIRRILELRILAAQGQREKLITLLKCRGSVTGPPDDEHNWEAVEAARLLALTPRETVALLVQKLQAPAPLTEPWLAYALGRCGTPEAIAWLKDRARTEEGYWAVQSFVYALSLAGANGRNALDALAVQAKGNLKPALEHEKSGRLKSLAPEVPRFPGGTIKGPLPSKLEELGLTLAPG